MTSLIKNKDKEQLLRNEDYKTNNKGWTFINFWSNSFPTDVEHELTVTSVTCNNRNITSLYPIPKRKII